MKYLLTLTMLMLVFGCTSKKDETKIDNKAQSQGGVDVGNMTSAMVPQTNASLTYPQSWSASLNSKSLSLQNSGGSKIQAEKAKLIDLVSPNSTSLQQYLKNKYPDRNYTPFEVNGLKGVRADIVNSSTEKQSDIYLVSEVNDFIHIQSSLKKENNGISSGEQIILTARVKYKGEAFANSETKTITLNAYSTGGQQLDKKAAYSFKDDCYSYVDTGCRGVSVIFGNGGGAHFSVGAAGYDHGRIVDLGSEAEIPFESIKIDGEYLIAPLTKISIADIYTAFTPKEQHAELDYIDLKEGHIYLIRTIRWPDEDMITKLKVESLTIDKSVTLDYQKMIYVKPEQLQKQVEEMNKFTLENEKPISEGEVTLHNQSIWGNYFYASFNFENSTSGNMFITYNSWDINFSNGCRGKPVLTVPQSGNGIGKVFDFGSIKIDAIQKSDFPDPNLYVYDCGQEIEKGKVYGIYHHDYDENIGAIYGAIQVLDIASDNSWVRLKFKRIYLGKAEHFQKWIDLNVPETIQSVRLEKTDNYNTQIFYPFIGKTGLEGSHNYEYVSFNPAESTEYPDELFTDNRPFGKDRGFIILGQNLNLNAITLAEVEQHKGSFESYISLKQGDVIAAYLENYYDKTVFIFRVDQLASGQSVALSVKYLQRQKSLFSDDKD